MLFLCTLQDSVCVESSLSQGAGVVMKKFRSMDTGVPPMLPPNSEPVVCFPTKKRHSLPLVQYSEKDDQKLSKEDTKCFLLWGLVMENCVLL